MPPADDTPRLLPSSMVGSAGTPSDVSRGASFLLCWPRSIMSLQAVKAFQGDGRGHTTGIAPEACPEPSHTQAEARASEGLPSTTPRTFKHAAAVGALQLLQVPGKCRHHSQHSRKRAPCPRQIPDSLVYGNLCEQHSLSMHAAGACNVSQNCKASQKDRYCNSLRQCSAASASEKSEG